MRTTAILNLKGGVAKTATTVNMAAILAANYHKRVLVVDADSQCNTTEFFGGAGTCSTFADMLRREDVNCCIRAGSFPDVDLLPADDSLMDLDLSKVEDNKVDVACLRRHLQTGVETGIYDYVLIDCPPAFNAASAAALLAADDVIIPIKLDAFSLRGMANRSASIQEATAALQASGLPAFPPIRRTPKVDDMTFAQEPLIKSSPKSAACIDYRRFVKVYVEGGERNGRI